MGHWPINRRCANKLCAYGVLPMLLVKLHNWSPTTPIHLLYYFMKVHNRNPMEEEYDYRQT